MIDDAAAPSESAPKTHGPLAGSTLLRTAAVLAIVVAWLEIGVRLAFLHFAKLPFGAGADIVWMAPVMNAVWFGGGAALALAGRRLIPRLFTPPINLALVTFPAYLTTAWLIPKIHKEAAVILAAGLAVQTGRLRAARVPGLDRLTRRSLLPATVIAALAVVVVLGRRQVRESAAGDGAAPAGAPNILLLLLDTVRSYSVSGYGYARPTTPALDSLAQAGARFDRAFAPASWTMPSHASLFTGQWPFELRTGPRTPLGPAPTTVAEAMRDAGWATGGFAANHAYLTWEHGLTRGFQHWEGYPVDAAMLFTATAIGRTLMEYNTFRKPIGYYDSPKRKSAHTVNEQFLDWVGGREGEHRPFFAFLNYFDAHHPYLPPEPYLTRFGPAGTIRWRGRELEFDELDSAEIRRKHNQYDGGISYIDAEIGRMLGELRTRGVLANTIVIVTSDHGEQWGEHERMSHGNSMYRELLQVPLIIAGERVTTRPGRIPSVVSLRDLPATILEAAGVRQPESVGGASLLPLLRGDTAAARSPAFAEDASFGTRGVRALIDDRYQYLRDRNGAERLFDVERDSLALHDLAPDPAHAAALAAMRARMDSVTGGAPPPDLPRR